MRGRPRLVLVALCVAVAVFAAGCGGSSATPLPTLPPVTEPPAASESPAVETLAPETEPPAASGEPQATEKPSTGGTKYKVKKGDTLWGIGQKYASDYGVSVSAMVTKIKKANPKIKADNVIHVGQILIIPAK
jgi:pilus assembly protein FimV